MKGEILSIDTAKKIANLEKENERLNNIINELEKYLWEERRSHQGEYIFTDNRGVEIYTMIFYKLQELKLKESE